MARNIETERGGMTLLDCAQRLYDEGLTDRVLSRERMRQIEKRALKKLRAALDKEGLTFEDLVSRNRETTDWSLE